MPLPSALRFFRATFSSLAISLLLTDSLGGKLAAATGPTISQEHIADANPTTAAERIASLRTEIARHDALYFKKAEPEIGDAEYDRLKRELVQWEEAFPSDIAAADVSPVGDDRTPGFVKRLHREPMLGLEKSHSETELRAFLGRVRKVVGKHDPAFVIEPKFDGVALSVIYEKGKLVSAVTRGNGREGDDVTTNARAIRNLPRRLNAISSNGTRNTIPDLVELRGEVYVSTAEFQRINRERESAGEPLFTHPRNVAAGTLKQHDPREIAARGLDIVFHGVGAVTPANSLPPTQHEFYALVQAWGLPGAGVSNIVRSDDDVWAGVRALEERRPHLEFPTDGAVIKLDSFGLRHHVRNGPSAPRWAIAHKFAPDRVETTLLHIRLQVGRTGVVTPVADLAPVRLAGATINRATLHNREEIARRDLRIGDTVILEKAGEIVPRIVGVNAARRPAESQPFVFPTACLDCEAPLVADAGGAIVRCPNRNCPAQVCRRLEHFASHGAVNIEGLGPSTIAALVEKGWVQEIPDLYRLRRDQLLTLGLNVDVTADRLLAAIETSKQADLWRFIYGLGIPGVGAVKARELSRHHDGLESIAAAFRENSSNTPNADGAARGAANDLALRNYFSDQRHGDLIANLTALGVCPRTTPPPDQSR